MAMNRIQFQQGLSLSEFFKRKPVREGAGRSTLAHGIYLHQVHEHGLLHCQ